MGFYAFKYAVWPLIPPSVNRVKCGSSEDNFLTFLLGKYLIIAIILKVVRSKIRIYNLSNTIRKHLIETKYLFVLVPLFIKKYSETDNKNQRQSGKTIPKDTHG